MAGKRPFITTVAGQQRTVVQSKPAWWVEQRGHDDHVIHVGRLLDKQEPIQILAEPKPCSRCKTPAVTATARGRAHHPQCEGWLEVLPDDLANQVIFGVAADLRARVTANF